MGAALGDAAWMTGMERNSDLVIMQAYAPLLGRANRSAGKIWQLIGYDAAASYGSPSYYAQVMYNTRRGDLILASSAGVAPGFFTSVTRGSKTGTIFVKAVNALEAPRTVRIAIAGATTIEPEGKMIVLTGKPGDSNSLQEPMKVVPVEHLLTGVSATFEQVFLGYSVTVLELHTQ